MSKVITFSRVFPKYHHKAVQPTYFVEKIWKSLYELNLTGKDFDDIIQKYCESIAYLPKFNGISAKHHTIRAGNRWKVGDKFSPRVWSGKPYNSKQITIAPDIEIKKVWDFEIIPTDQGVLFLIDSVQLAFWYKELPVDEDAIDDLTKLAKHDGLTVSDLISWFQFPKPFKGQIICWSDAVSY